MEGGVGEAAGAEARGVAFLDELRAELSGSGLDAGAILSRLVWLLSRARAGTWIATLMSRDPAQSRVTAADHAEPQMAEYVERYIAALQRPGRAPTAGLVQHVIETDSPLVLRSISYSDYMATVRPEGVEFMKRNAPPMATEGTKLGVLIVPLRARGAVLGTIGLHTKVGADISDDEVAWLQAAADVAAHALDGALVHAAATERLERLTASLRVALAATASQDLRLTLQVILDQETAGLGVDAADLLLVDQSGRRLTVGAHKGFAVASVPDYQLPVDDDLAAAFGAGPAPASLCDLNRLEQSARRSLLAREGFRTYRATPLVVGKRLVGVLEIFDRGELETDKEWLDFLELLATQAAVAIDHATLTGRLDRSHAEGSRGDGGNPQFTRSESQVLKLLVDGLTNRQIAQKVFLSESTIKFHVRQLLRKAGVRNRTELVRRATQGGWV